MSQLTESNPYPVVLFLVAHGKSLATAVSAVLGVAVAGWGLYQQMLWLMPLAVLAAVVLWGVLRSYVEVLQIIADTLIPKY